MYCMRNLKSTANNRQSPLARFWRDESGQGIIFAAASMVMLVGFVALVYNVGHLTERRTKTQLAADACAYSGAMVMSNSLSTIAWTNSAMAQVYYNCLKYAVDVNVTGVAAAAERMNGSVGGPAYTAYQAAYQRAGENLPRGKEMLRDLSRIQNAIAIITPRLAEEEMFAVGARAGTVGETRGVERLSLFPSTRFFPLSESLISYRIEQLVDGWRITNLLGGNNEMISVRLVNGEWHIEYSMDGITQHKVIIREEPPQGDDELERWSVRHYEPPGNLQQEIILVHTSGLGWAVWGTESPGGGGEQEIPRITFERVNMIDPPPDGYGEPWTAGNEGTAVTYEDTREVFAENPEGDLMVWNSDRGNYVNMTSEETTIAGVTVRVNVTNTIHFPYGSARIADPIRVWIGDTELVLRDPPTIRTSLGPVSIAVTGFDIDTFSISAGGFSLTHGDADGIWRKHYQRNEEYWWQHRLTEQDPVAPDALKQWQYDRMRLGALLQYEANLDRFVYDHALGDRHGPGAIPEWTAWFDPETAKPFVVDSPYSTAPPNLPVPTPLHASRNEDFETVLRPDGSWYYELALDDYENLRDRSDVYYVTRDCANALCGGRGGWWEDVGGTPTWHVCDTCHGMDPDRDGTTEVRAFISDITNADWAGDMRRGLREADYIDARLYNNDTYGVAGAPRMPLILAPEFFKFGLNVGAARSAVTPMLFPAGREPDWGFAAIASARIGIRDLGAAGGYRQDFDDPDDRQVWCDESPYNLYVPDIRPRLVASKTQIKDFDLEDDLLQGPAIRPAAESGLSYLWDAIIAGGHTWSHNNWLDQYDGQPNPTIGASLRNMRDRQGRVFDYRHETLDDVVEH